MMLAGVVAAWTAPEETEKEMRRYIRGSQDRRA
jgi:hypothetical protein